MVAGTWLVLEDLSLQIELYRGDPPPTLTPETPTQSVRGLAEGINFGKGFTRQGRHAGERAGAAKRGEADVQEGHTRRPAAPRA